MRYPRSVNLLISKQSVATMSFYGQTENHLLITQPSEVAGEDERLSLDQYTFYRSSYQSLQIFQQRDRQASVFPNNDLSTRQSGYTRQRDSPVVTSLGSKQGDINGLSVQARSPQYRLKSVRISSFSKWPGDVTQTPDELAEAGFYYTGCRDIVRCYVCDGGLQKWNPEDNAWIEHARWFPHCAYVCQVKGKDFIELVRLSVEHAQLEQHGASGVASGHDEAANYNFTYCKNECSDMLKDEPETMDELIEETEKLRSVIKCLFCEENDANCLFLPCAHHRLCVQCSANVVKCPFCQKDIRDKVKTFMS